MKRILYAALATALLSTTAVADNRRAEMAAELEAAGFNETSTRRHEIHVQHCAITTYVFEDWEGHGKVLWSSFLFNLKDLELLSPQKDGRRYIWIENFRDGSPASMMLFDMREGTTARHEMAMRRNPKPPHRPSPRSGPDSYVYKDKTSFFILHEEHASPAKPDRFISLLEQYRFEFCLPIS